MEWVETTAKTTSEAKESALDRLGVHEDDAEFEIVSEPKTGLFGRVKEDARVRARVRPATPRAKDERRRRRGKNGGRGPRGQGRDGGDRSRGNAKKGKAKQNGGGRDGGGRDGAGSGSRSDKGHSQQKRRSQGAPAGSATSNDRSKKQENTVTDNEPTMPLPEQADIAQEFVAGLAERFGASVGFVREDVADDEIRLTVTGDDLGRMVGPRGNTAAAIDELVRTVLQRQAGSSRDGRVRVDVGGVRARRNAALERFCRDLAQEVRDTGVARALEPMNGADRKLTHDTIADEDGVETISEGEDPNRRVVIVPAGDA
jgi:spoIIIJ-associated protein